MKPKIIPEIGFLRLRGVIGDGDDPGIIPVSRSPWYKGIAERRYPKPVKLSERTSAWKIEDIRKLIRGSLVAIARPGWFSDYEEVEIVDG